MKNTNLLKKYFAILAICSIALLSGCDLISPGPNQVEISSLVKISLANQMNNENNANPIGGIISKIIGADQLVFIKIEKISCKGIGEKLVNCQVYVDYEIGTQDQAAKADDPKPVFKVNQKIQKTVNFNFFKSDTGWVNVN